MVKSFTKVLTAALLLFLVSLSIPIQGQVRISGFIRDKITGERLIGANIFQADAQTGTVTDNNGYFSMVSGVPCILRVSYVGYDSNELTILTPRDTLVEVRLEPGNRMDAVEVRATRIPKSNVASLKISELQQMPSLGAKPDVLKSMQLLPGIQSQNEGTSRLLVRGGDPGQNLYLFDNVPVIYVNHLGGFLSVFNPDIINTIDIYKGGFPARFGGRLSSVVDISQREGDRSALKGSFSIGITDASFTVEGPLKIRNTSFIVTGRKTLIDPLMALFSLGSPANDFVIAYGFHDLNGKFTWKPDNRNSVHLNFYQGDDYLNFWSNKTSNGDTEKSHLNNGWGNWFASGNWNRVISPRVFMTNSLSYTRYRLKNNLSFTVSDSARVSSFNRKYLSSVEDLSFRSNFKFQLLKNWTAEAGLQASFLTHVPNDTYQSNLPVQAEADRVRTLEPALYLDNKIVILRRIEANLGLRLVNYSTTDYSGFSLEPRANINIGITDKHHLNLSYMRVTQNSHLLVTTGSIMSNEVWVPADNRIPPALSDQYSVGWSGTFYQDRLQAEIAVYYKTMEQLTTYREGYASLMGDAGWRSKIISGGSGKSMGIEFLVRKTYGSWTGFASYSWSHTIRQYPEINGGKEYLFEYNRPHTASLNINHKFNSKWSVNLTWVYQTGLPYTPVLGRQNTLNTVPDENGNFGSYEVLLYGERNSARMKNYHRLDIGVTLNTLSRRGRKTIWTFSVYNLYNRHNPYYYFYNTTANNTDYDRPEYMTVFRPMNLYQMSFFPIIPSVSYKVIFDGTSVKRAKRHSRDSVLARGSSIKNRLNIRAGYASIPGFNYRKDVGMKSSFGNFRVETNYHLLKFLEIGGYLGYSRYSGRLNPQNIILSYENTPFIGISVNLQVLPFIVKNADSRFDLYLLGRYGGAYYTSPVFHNFADEGFHLNYSHGAGFAFYLTKHIGVFSEFSFTGLDLKQGNLRYGLSVKF